MLFPVQNVQIRQYSMLLACGCIIGAQLSHWHGSNLCLQALKSAVTDWNNNCVLWLLTGASSESLLKETAASHRTNWQLAWNWTIGGLLKLTANIDIILDIDIKTCKNLPNSTNSPHAWVKYGTNVPAHSQEHCTRKADRPPSLQRACNVTVGEEQRRTLLWFRFDLRTGKS